MKKILFLLLVLSMTILFADTFSDGLSEYKKGNKVRAFRIYNNSCNDGNMFSCLNLGFLYYYGDGIEQNKKIAHNIYQKICDADVYAGCYELGSLHEYGNGVEKNKEKAMKFYKKACALGSNASCGMYKKLNGYK